MHVRVELLPAHAVGATNVPPRSRHPHRPESGGSAPGLRAPSDPRGWQVAFTSPGAALVGVPVENSGAGEETLRAAVSAQVPGPFPPAHGAQRLPRSRRSLSVSTGGLLHRSLLRRAPRCVETGAVSATASAPDRGHQTRPPRQRSVEWSGNAELGAQAYLHLIPLGFRSNAVAKCCQMLLRRAWQGEAGLECAPARAAQRVPRAELPCAEPFVATTTFNARARSRGECPAALAAQKRAELVARLPAVPQGEEDTKTHLVEDTIETVRGPSRPLAAPGRAPASVLAREHAARRSADVARLGRRAGGGGGAGGAPRPRAAARR